MPKHWNACNIQGNQTLKAKVIQSYSMFIDTVTLNRNEYQKHKNNNVSGELSAVGA
jgi:hypothetical protein